MNVRELGQSVPHLGEPEAMCRGSMLSVLERASPQPSSDTNGRFFFPRRKLASRVSHDIVQANSYARFAGEFGGVRDACIVFHGVFTSRIGSVNLIERGSG